MQSDELMWLRTTLCFRAGGGWEVLVFCEAVGEVPGCIDELSWRWSPLPTNMQCRLRAWDFTCLTMDSVQKRLMRV